MILKGVIFENRNAFNGVQTAVYNYYKANVSNTGLTQLWSDGRDSSDSTEVFMRIDDRVTGFNWNPHAIVDIDTTNPKWFPTPSND